MELDVKFKDLGRKLEVLSGLILVLLANLILGFNDDLAKLDLSLQMQAVLIFSDWVWPVILLPKMEWQYWHNKWTLIWLMLVVLETGAMWWYFSAELGQSFESGASIAVSSLILRLLGVILMKP